MKSIFRESTYLITRIFLGLAVTSFVGREGLVQFGKVLPGALESDSGLVSGYFAALESNRIGPFANVVISNINWPIGLRNHGVLNQTSPLSVLSEWILSGLLKPVSAQYALGFIGMFLSFVIASYALRNLKIFGLYQLLGAILISVSPMMMQWWSANPPYAQNWIYVLVIWSAIRFTQSPRLRTGAYLGLSTFLGVLWSQYVAVFCLVIAAVSYLIASTREKRFRVRNFVSIFLLSIASITYYILISFVDKNQIPVRQSSDALLLYLHPTELLDSSKATYLGVGLILLVLAALGMNSNFKNFVQSKTFVCASSFMVLFVFFSNPMLGGVPLPGRIISLVVPQIRSGWYVAQPMQVLLVFIGIVGISELGNRFNKNWRLSLLVLVGILLILDNYRLPSTETGRWMSLAPPSSITATTLRDLPAGAVAHFPWELSSEYPAGAGPNPCLFMRVHRHPIVNTCGIHYSSNDSFPTIDHLREIKGCAQVEALRQLRVRYLLIEAPFVQPILMNCLKHVSNRTRLVVTDEHYAMELWELVP